MPKDRPAGRQQLERRLEGRRGAEEGEEFKPIRRGWCLGEEALGQELPAPTSARLRAEQDGKERAETEAAKVGRIMAAELRRRRWREAELRRRPKRDAVKGALAARLGAETTSTVGWVAERLETGTRGHLNHRLYRRRTSTWE